ncbi:MAG TPA: hypothetical protein VG675_06980 [Bryobacteraceae bacterium]|nr:hypothetical protein [Bryobacteraceae bacterium]
MGTRFAVIALILGLGAAGTLHADLTKARSERNLEKRSKLALENADVALIEARAAYKEGDLNQVSVRIQEVVDSVELAHTSLKETGKNPRKSPKWFKRAEIATRDLARKLESFQEEMSYTDRPLLDKAKARVQQIHDELLMGLMEGRRK